MDKRWWLFAFCCVGVFVVVSTDVNASASLLLGWLLNPSTHSISNNQFFNRVNVNDTICLWNASYGYACISAWNQSINVTGLQGPAGTNGTDGINGTNGLNGTNGTNGINGTNGLDANWLGNYSNGLDANWIPFTTSVYDLGNTTNVWSNLFMDGNLTDPTPTWGGSCSVKTACDVGDYSPFTNDSATGMIYEKNSVYGVNVTWLNASQNVTTSNVYGGASSGSDLNLSSNPSNDGTVFVGGKLLAPLVVGIGGMDLGGYTRPFVGLYMDGLVHIKDVGGTHWMKINPGVQLADVNYTLPNNASSVNGHCLTSTTAGAMSWENDVVVGSSTTNSTINSSTVTTENMAVKAPTAGGGMPSATNTFTTSALQLTDFTYIYPSNAEAAPASAYLKLNSGGQLIWAATPTETDPVWAANASGTCAIKNVAATGAANFSGGLTASYLSAAGTLNASGTTTLKNATIDNATVNSIITSFPSSFSAYNASAFSLSTTTGRITFATELWDSRGEYATPRYTAQLAGIYSACAQLDCNNVNGQVNMTLSQSGATNVTFTARGTAAGNGTTVHGCASFKLAAAGYLEVYGWASAAIACTGGQARTWFTVTKIA
jgi:hypothetical protein